MINPKKLTNRVLENFAIPVSFAKQKFLFDGEGVLYWPQKDTLVFSDLHFEKGSFLTQFAHPVPRFDTLETIKRMQKLIEIYHPRRVVCLGDSFHDANAVRRMETKSVELLNELVGQSQEWSWVLGNHDPEIPDIIKGERCTSWLKEGILFTHEPVDLNHEDLAHAQIIGHYHPKVSTKLNNIKITGKCFVCAENIAILPAFGKYTGGLSVKDDTISCLINEQTVRKYLTYSKKLFML